MTEENELPKFESGSIINGRYRISKRVGVGASGQVFRATDLTLDDDMVALKIVHIKDPSTDGIPLARLRNEVRIARRLGHPQIVRVYDFGVISSDLFFISMEYIGGANLYNLMISQPNKKLSISRTLPILHQLSKALLYAHANGVIHRDIKPENILISAGGEIKLGDFGVAKDITANARLTREGHVIGTLGYIAPEQIAGHKPDGRADIYALGALTYELLTGDQAVTASTEAEALVVQSKISLPLLGQLPWWLQNFIELCTEFDPDQRFQTIAEVELTLRQWITEREVIESKFSRFFKGISNFVSH